MKKLCFLFIFVFCATASYSQLDKSSGNNTKGGIRIPAVETPVPESPKPKKEQEEQKENPFSKFKDPIFEAPKKTIDFIGAEKEPFSMSTDNGLLTYEIEDFTPKAFKKDKEIREEYRSDQHLGEFLTTGTFVELYCRDHEYVDGDKVRVYVNGKLVHNSLSLGASYSPILVKLKTGYNTVEFVALNQGSSGPNTAELKLFDDLGQPLANKEWNLLTGATARLVVVKN